MCSAHGIGMCSGFNNVGGFIVRQREGMLLLCVVVCFGFFFTLTQRVALLLQTAMMLSKRGLNLIGVIKTAHALFLKDYIPQLLGPLPAASTIVLKAAVEGEDLALRSGLQI